MKNSKRIVLKLNTLNTHLQSESDGDELFLKYQGKKIAPQQEKFFKSSRSGVSVNTEIEVDTLGKWVEIELWEYDFLSPNDCLGTYKLFVDKRGGPYIADLIANKDSKAKYSLTWEVDA